jgi:hypothetical protein
VRLFLWRLRCVLRHPLRSERTLARLAWGQLRAQVPLMPWERRDPEPFEWPVLGGDVVFLWPPTLTVVHREDDEAE